MESFVGGLDELHLPSCQYKGSIKPSITHFEINRSSQSGDSSDSLMFDLIGNFYYFYAWRKRSAYNDSNMLPMEQQFPMISYAELSKATDNFSPANKIGEGRFNIVYKGILDENRSIVAVKVVNLTQKGASRSFLAECEALRNIRHRNLIKIITICSSIDFKGVDMQNGNLEQWLHQSNGQLRLCNSSLTQRLNMAIDVVFAIAYLHHHCQPSIVHGDLKPSNILLDQDVVAHVGDWDRQNFYLVINSVLPQILHQAQLG